MEGWVKTGVQRASVLYPNSCYNESCYIEVQVYYVLALKVHHFPSKYFVSHKIIRKNIINKPSCSYSWLINS